MATDDADQKIVFALSPDGQGDGIPVLILGVPEGAWDYMKDGKTHTFDLTSAGLPVKLVLFGAESHAAAKGTIEEIAASTNHALLDRRRDDFSMKPKRRG